MIERSRNLCVYPNVYLMDQFGSQIRVLRPLAVNKTEVIIYCIAPKNEDPKSRVHRIRQYEDFFNDKSIKNQVTARYIYEHLFLDHISFDDNSKNFFQIIRSSTPSGIEAKIIPTRYPYEQAIRRG